MKEFIMNLLKSKTALVALVLFLLILFNPIGLGNAVIVIFAMIGAWSFFKNILPELLKRL